MNILGFIFNKGVIILNNLTELYNDLRLSAINTEYTLENNEPQYIKYQKTEKNELCDTERRLLEKNLRTVLSDREISILADYYDKHLSDTEIGTKYNLNKYYEYQTQAEASLQQRKRLIHLLRKPLYFVDWIFVFGTEEEKTAWGVYDILETFDPDNYEDSYLIHLRRAKIPAEKADLQRQAILKIRPTKSQIMYRKSYENLVRYGKRSLNSLRSLTRTNEAFRRQTGPETIAKLEKIFDR